MSPACHSRCKYNQSRILTNCSHLRFLEWPEDTTVIIFQELFGTLGGMALILNCLVLLESRYTSGGQSASLVFVRSLLVGDVLIGLFGIIKAIYIEFRKDRKIDCFLSESLLITASTASAFSLLWLTADSSLKLTRPLDLHFRMHKKNVIALMVILWNGSFIVGFTPQMGWVLIDCTCLFFCYYQPMYLLFVGVLWDLCIVLTVCLLVYQRLVRRQYRNSSSSLSLDSQEGKKYTMLIILVRVHIIVWLLSYLPLKVFVIIKYFYLDDNSRLASYIILYFLLLPLLKAIVCAILHGYQAREMRNVISNHCYHLVWCCSCWTPGKNTTYSVSIVGDGQLSSSMHFPSQLTFSSTLSTDQLSLSVAEFTTVTSNAGNNSGHSETAHLEVEDELKICKFFRDGRRCWLGKRCPYKHIRLEKDCLTADKREAVCDVGLLGQMELPQVGLLVGVEVSAVSSPVQFYVIFPWGTESVKNLNSMPVCPNKEETLPDLQESLQKCYEKLPPRSEENLLWTIGELVVARAPADEQWYRARISDVSDMSNSVKVFFVDYGNVQWILEKHIQPIRPQFVHLPHQAVECCLNGIVSSSANGVWTQEARDYFVELVDDIVLVAHVNSIISRRLYIDLYNTSNDEDENIAEELVRVGVACKLETKAEPSKKSTVNNQNNAGSTSRVLLTPG